MSKPACNCPCHSERGHIYEGDCCAYVAQTERDCVIQMKECALRELVEAERFLLSLSAPDQEQADRRAKVYNHLRNAIVELKVSRG